MAICDKIVKKNRGICIGALNKLIIIQTRAITSPIAGSNTNFTESFTNLKTVWALINTVSGETLFDGTGIERVVTHVFFIRKLANVSIEHWIKYNSEYYDILNVENFDEDGLFLKINTAKRGTTSNSANYA